jgi:hypothetical protein
MTMTTKSSLSNSLNSSGGTFNSNSSLNSAPSADRYAALKDLDEQLREAKTVETAPAPTEPAGKSRCGRVAWHNLANLRLSRPQEFP